MKTDDRVFIIAEAGVNHNGSLELAFKLVAAAADAGADAVKFQTFKASSLVTDNAKRADYQVKNTKSDDTQLSMLQKLELSYKDHFKLLDYCKTKNIKFMSSAFDDQSLDFLVNELQVDILKIPSGEIANAPFVLKHAQTKKHLILSTGMTDLSDIEQALGVIAFGLTKDKNVKPSVNDFKEAYYDDKSFQVLKEKVTILHCTTEYPAKFNEINLKVMRTFTQCFDLPVGYSDHSEGISVPIAAVALGARVIEKHFTLDKNMEGPDHIASLEPHELKVMVKSIREVECALGSSVKKPSGIELANKKVAHKSLAAKFDIKKGEVFTEENLCAMRPGTGISPLNYWEYLGQSASRNYSRGELIDG